MMIYFLNWIQVRIHHRKSNIDARTAQSIKFESPVFLINIFHDILLVYNADSRVSFYQLLLDEQTSRELFSSVLYILILYNRKRASY